MWQKGQSGNPRGRKAEKPFKDALRMQLAAAGEDQKALREIADQLIASARSGDRQSIVDIRDTLDGKPAQAIVGDDEQDPVTVRTIVTGVPRREDESR